jgi:hypothetical protein
LVSVTVLAALVLPTTMLPKLNETAESVTCAAPDPVTATVCVPALSTIVKVAAADPATVGAKVTATVQEAPGATLALQVFV